MMRPWLADPETVTVTAADLREMREWFKDCEWGDGPHDFDAMPDAAILTGIRRHYWGGIDAFIGDGSKERTLC